MKLHVGIEALAIEVPSRYLELEDLARARGVDPAKFTAGLGVRQMAVPDPSEDTVALAATAAERLLCSAEVDVRRIGMLVVGTETGVDHSKPVASYVQGLLELPRHMRTFDTQHACYGGTAALMAACEWIASGAAAGRSALVICADIARYGLRTPGEPTQGAAAVALLVSDRPRLLELDLGVSGTSSQHVHDFWRPLGRREALVDGHYSIDCYLEAVSGAYRGWKERALERGLVRRGPELPSEQLARILYHVPFCKMARKAHARVRRCDLEDAGAVGPAKALDELAQSTQSFDAQVTPSLDVCASVGNAYTAALYLALTGLLEKDGKALAGQRIGLFSYGSGCSSEFFSAVVGPEAGYVLEASDVRGVLDRRQRISVAEYEQLAIAGLDGLVVRPPLGIFRMSGVQDHRRTYAGAPART